jgi:hypothetical protein
VNEVDHGPKISGEEYDKRIVALHENLPPSLSSDQEREVRRQELEIMIDYRLGTHFPKERREQLWQVADRVDKKRLSLMTSYLLRRPFKGRFLKKSQGLAGYVVDEYAKVLDRSELVMFFGEEETEHPSLPIDDK